MNANVASNCQIHDLTINEMKMINGGEPSKSTSFFYDAVYYATYYITKSEILTFKFWEDWGYSIL